MIGSAGRRGALVVGVLALSVALLPRDIAGQQRPDNPLPTFWAGVGMVSVDVHVLSSAGDPIEGLATRHFEVWIDGRKRKVTTATLIRHAETAAADLLRPKPAPVLTPGRVPPGTRLYLIAVDESSFPMTSVRPAMQATTRFIERLEPEDMVGLYVFPIAPRKINLTHDHRAVARALGDITGLRTPLSGEFDLTASEIVDINARDGSAFATIIERECDPTDLNCPDRVRAEATIKAGHVEAQVQQSLSALGDMLASLAALPGRKTVLFLSGGLIAADRVAGRPDVSSILKSVAEQAGMSNVNLYVLHTDNGWSDGMSAANRPTRSASARFQSLFRDTEIDARGLELFAGYAGGSLMRIQAGTGDYAFDRVRRETTAHYMLGVEPAREDRDGRQHYIRVKVDAKGATVRNRTQVFIPRALSRAQ
jgi:VWFA-related protein